MVQTFQTTWAKGYVRPRLQRNGQTQQKIDEDNALVRICEITARECPDITILTIRSSVHATTCTKHMKMRRVPAAPHITAGFRHGPGATTYNSHIVVNNYRDPFTTYWPSVDRREITWGLFGQGPDYPGFRFGVEASNASGDGQSMAWDAGDWPALGH